MKGFKEFVLRGNLVELAVAFIIGAAFATVVKAFTDVVIEALAKAGGAPSFNDWRPGGFDTIGPFLTAAVAFLLTAAIVYFFVVKPYEAAKARFFPAEPQAATIDPNTELLTEIRDALRAPRA
ncbi:MscL family protein [Oryzobacter telluris]|uniref:MscL family protein n=1 Tax=Oryzobacter telluris TaxID=3149179 RepID=UPI00370D9699